jgi:site-specific DNA-methyltransferase (adenine-specific)
MKMNASQAPLFEVTPELGLAIESAAQKAKVSSATIRNWIKTGSIKQNSYGNLDIDSFENFLAPVVGQKKLVGRANKSLKDSHNHEDLSEDFLISLRNVDCDVSSLAKEYESALSDSYRNREGVYYTPPKIVANLLNSVGQSTSSTTFLDPCCGSGNFILRAIELGVEPKNVFGFDTDPVAVELTKRRIFEQTGYKSTNIIVADFFEEALLAGQQKFDVIYTNPPWGKKLEKEVRERLGKAFNAGKSVDTCSIFFFACMNCLDSEGEMGLLLPDSFFNIAAFESARIKALSYEIVRLVDYERPFKGLLTKAFGIVLKKVLQQEQLSPIICETREKQYRRTAESFSKNPKSIINFQCDPVSARVIEHIYSIPHITLNNRAQWGLGIVTGNNEKFFQKAPSEEFIPVVRGADITKNGLLKAEFFIPKDLSLYQQVAPVYLYESKVKLIYKFISSNLCFYCDTQQRYVLNSANLLIPNDDFPISAGQLCDLLNCDFLNWIFSELFKTHKVLRGDLESLPIYPDFFQDDPKFNEERFLNFLSLEQVGNGSYRIKK